MENIVKTTNLHAKIIEHTCNNNFQFLLQPENLQKKKGTKTKIKQQNNIRVLTANGPSSFQHAQENEYTNCCILVACVACT